MNTRQIDFLLQVYAVCSTVIYILCVGSGSDDRQLLHLETACDICSWSNNAQFSCLDISCGSDDGEVPALHVGGRADDGKDVAGARGQRQAEGGRVRGLGLRGQTDAKASALCGLRVGSIEGHVHHGGTGGDRLSRKVSAEASEERNDKIVCLKGVEYLCP